MHACMHVCSFHLQVHLRTLLPTQLYIQSNGMHIAIAIKLQLALASYNIARAIACGQYKTEKCFTLINSLFVTFSQLAILQFKFVLCQVSVYWTIKIIRDKLCIVTCSYCFTSQMNAVRSQLVQLQGHEIGVDSFIHQRLVSN